MLPLFEELLTNTLSWKANMIKRIHILKTSEDFTKRVLKNTIGYRITALIALFCLSSCTVIGSKETFVIKDSSAWRAVSQGSQVSYSYKCDKLSINIEEILVKSTMLAYGPIVPVIPSGKITDKTEQLFELEIRVVGEVNEALTNGDNLGVQVIGTSKEFYPTTHDFSKVSEQPYSSNLWIQYHFKYGFPHKLEELNNLIIRLQLPFADCNPPELLLERKDISNNEIIVAPGA